MPGPYYQTGKYLSEIMDIAFDETDSQTKIVVKVRIMSEWNYGENDWVPCAKQYDRTIWLNIPDEEEYRPYVAMKLREAGWQGSQFENLRGDMVGQHCVVVNEIRTAKGGKYAGQEVEGWDFPLPPKKESKPLEHKPMVARKLNALLGDILKSTAPSNPSPPEPVLAAGDPPPEDDIPF